MESEPAAIEIRDLTFSYGSAPVLADAQMRVERGDLVAVVGPNGSGKTTLLKLILGMLQPGKGEVRVLGETPEKARPRVGYVPQHADLDASFPARVIDVALMGRLGRSGWLGPFLSRDRKRAMDSLDRVGMSDKATLPFSSLSGGQKQRVLIARALATQPELLLLDEPTSNVDSSTGNSFIRLLKELSSELTVVLVTHDISLVSEQIPRCACVGKGRIVLHPTSDLTGETLDELWGGDMRLIRHDQSCSSEGHKWQTS